MLCTIHIQEKLDAQQPSQPQGAMVYAVVDKTKKQAHQQENVSSPFNPTYFWYSNVRCCYEN